MRDQFFYRASLFEKVNNYKFRKLNDKLKIMNKISKNTQYRIMILCCLVFQD